MFAGKDSSLWHTGIGCYFLDRNTLENSQAEHFALLRRQRGEGYLKLLPYHFAQASVLGVVGGGAESMPAK